MKTKLIVLCLLIGGTSRAQAVYDSLSCGIDSLVLNTGYDPINDTLYGEGIQDQFWQLVSLAQPGSVYSVPSCAIRCVEAVQFSAQKSAWISYDSKPYPFSGNSPGNFFWNYDHSIGQVLNNAAPFTVRRHFYVLGTLSENITIDISGQGDDIITDIILDSGTVNQQNLYTNSTISTSPASITMLSNLVVSVGPGIHTLDVNFYDISGLFTGTRIEGSLYSPNSKLVKPSCYEITPNCEVTYTPVEIPSEPTKVRDFSANNFALSLYPNPATDAITVSVSANKHEEAIIELMDITGKVLKTVKSNHTQVSMDVSDIVTGVYFVKYSQGNQSRTIRVNKL